MSFERYFEGVLRTSGRRTAPRADEARKDFEDTLKWHLVLLN